MSLIGALILAADPGRGGQDPGGGLSALLIVAVVVAVVAVVAAILFAFPKLSGRSRVGGGAGVSPALLSPSHKLSGRSRGGVEPAPGEFRRGGPPFESIGRRGR